MILRLLVPASVLTLAFAVSGDSKEVKLPPPFATPSVDNGPHVIDEPEGAELKLPTGFQVDIYAEGFERPRFMLLGPKGELLVSDSADSGVVYLFEDAAKPGQRKKLIQRLDRPYGLAFWKDYLYAGEQTSVKRHRYDAENHTAGLGGGHWTRSLLFDGKGEKLYVGVGSRSNVSAGEDPRRKGEKPDLVAKTIVPDVILPAHVAVLDYLFYTGTQFPPEYRGGAFLAFHGSWNRSKRVGQEIAFLPFKNGKPAAEQPRHFLTGCMLAPDKREVWGRPVALLQMADGSVLVSDDGGNKIWRISYKGN
ncbi:MAG TPA: hypothetical protein VMT32_15895 [Bryobacteraceae bacterium]|nr:hypothetical protein [Bryobacteraceae bacterium]